MKKVFIYIVLILVFGCQRQANLNNEFEEQKQVVHCYFQNDQPFKVFATVTATPTDSILYPVDTNATVILYENNAYKEVLNYIPANGYFLSNTTAVPGIEYKIEVRNSKFGDIRKSIAAKSQLPPAISIVNASFKDSVKTDPNGNYLGRIHFEINDPNTVNHYQIGLKYYDISTNTYASMTKFEGDINWLRFTEKSNTNGYYNINDDLFNGQNVSFDLYVNSIDYHINGLTQFAIELNHLSNEWVLYQNSLKQYIDGKGIDPVQIYSNFDYGYGIFASKNVSVKIIQ